MNKNDLNAAVESWKALNENSIIKLDEMVSKLNKGLIPSEKQISDLVSGLSEWDIIRVRIKDYISSIQKDGNIDTITLEEFTKLSDEYISSFFEASSRITDILEQFIHVKSDEQYFDAAIEESRNDAKALLEKVPDAKSPENIETLVKQTEIYDYFIKAIRIVAENVKTKSEVLNMIPSLFSPDVTRGVYTNMYYIDQDNTATRLDKTSETNDSSDASEPSADTNENKVDLVKIVKGKRKKIKVSSFKGDMESHIHYKIFVTIGTYKVMSLDQLCYVVNDESKNNYDEEYISAIAGSLISRGHLYELEVAGLKENVYVVSTYSREAFDKASIKDRLFSYSNFGYPEVFKIPLWEKTGAPEARSHYYNTAAVIQYGKLIQQLYDHTPERSEAMKHLVAYAENFALKFNDEEGNKQTAAIIGYDMLLDDQIDMLSNEENPISVAILIDESQIENCKSALKPHMSDFINRAFLITTEHGSVFQYRNEALTEIGTIFNMFNDSAKPKRSKKSKTQLQDETGRQREEITSGHTQSTSKQKDKATEENKKSIEKESTQKPSVPKKKQEKSSSKEQLDLKAIASQIIENNEDFEICNVQLSDLIWTTIQEGRVPEALVLTKAIIESNKTSDKCEEFTAVYDWFRHSINNNLDELKYTSANIEELDLYDISDSLIPTKILSTMKQLALIWAMLRPTKKYDHGFRDNHKEIMDVNTGVSLKSIHHLLHNMHLNNEMMSGFSKSIVSLLESNRDRNIVQSDFAKRASHLQIVPSPTQRIKNLHIVYKNAFGKSSPLYELLSLVRDNASDGIEKLSKSSFYKVVHHHEMDDTTIEINNHEVEEFILNEWNKVRGDFDLENSAYKNIKSHIVRRLELTIDWYEHAKNNNVLNTKILNKFDSVRQRVIGAILNIHNKIESSSRKPNPVVAQLVRFSTNRMKDYLQGVSNQNDYLNFYKTPYVLMIDQIPDFKAEFISVTGYEPWRLIVKHLATDLLDLEDAAHAIDKRDNPHWYCNYGQLEQIHDILNPDKDITDFEMAKKAADKYADHKYQEFCNEVEMAFALFRINESQTEYLTSLADRNKDYFVQYSEAGKFVFFLETLEKQIQIATLKKQELFMQRFRKIELNIDKTDNNIEKVLSITKNWIDKGNFTVAEEYLNSLASGEAELIFESIQNIEFTNYRNDFFDKHHQLARACSANSGKRLASFGADVISSYQPKTSKSQFNKTVRNITGNWPRITKNEGSSGSYAKSENDIRDLMKVLGFSATTATYDIAHRKNYSNSYDVDVVATNVILPNFSHPIPEFGTQMTEFVKVLAIFGDRGNKGITTDISNLLSSSPTIVLIDRALKLSDRREIAELVKGNSLNIPQPFILIDWVLALYLCTVVESDRMAALLQCSLPFTNVMPFVKLSGKVADEMFIGRSDQLKDILSKNGSKLVYGGRQLGKTALLRRAQSLKNNPENKVYALYLEAKNMNEEKLTQELSELFLKNELYVTGSSKVKTIEEFFKKLDDIWDNQISELHLYIDEADAFLDECSKDGYQLLNHFIKLASNRNFRFVFAGLHDVLRSHTGTSHNSSLPQLGDPLAIKPLSPFEGFSLLAKPLSFMGIDLEYEQAALILANSMYYPGIIHLLGYSLVNSISEQYKSKFYDAQNNPPYFVNAINLKKIFRNENINDKIKERLDMTLDLEKPIMPYRKIAAVFSYLYHTDKDIVGSDGIPIERIMNFIKQQKVPSIKDLSAPGLKNLLLEMVGMGILASNINDTKFMLRKTRFRDLIARDDMEAMAMIDPELSQ